MYSAITQATGPLVSWPESQNPTLSYKITLRAGSIKYGTPCSFGNLRNNNLKSPLAASQALSARVICIAAVPRSPGPCTLQERDHSCMVLQPCPSHEAGAGGQGLLPPGLCPGKSGSQCECFSSAQGSLAQTSPCAFWQYTVVLSATDGCAGGIPEAYQT